MAGSGCSAMATTSRIAFVICWLGKWPSWFDAFLLSCAANPHVDFLLFTDCEAPAELPANVRLHPTTLADLAHLASRRLGYHVPLETPYKLCDWKPLYGHLFAEELRRYDFWGHCDLDVVWGDIAKFFGPQELASYDVLTASETGVIGHCTLYRNRPEINGIAVRQPGLKGLLRSRRHKANDEHHFNAYLQRGWPGLARYHVLSTIMTAMSRRPLRLAFERAPWFAELNSTLMFRTETSIERWLGDRLGGPRARMLSRQLQKPGPLMEKLPATWSWEGGRLQDEDGVEWMYLHFQRWKRGPILVDFRYPDRPERVTIAASDAGVMMSGAA